MQKKYVLPILMVAPAIPAMQAINIPAPNASADKSDWTLSGVVAGTLSYEQGLISAPLGGTITTTVKNLPKGSYKLHLLSGTRNADISVNGKAITAKDGIVAFTADGNDVTISVVGHDNTLAFDFGIETIELVFDFGAAKTALQKQLDDVKVLAPADPEKPHTKELEDLATARTKIQGDIDKVVATDPEDYKKDIETYNKFKFADDNDKYTANTIATAIAAFAGDVKKFNDTVEPENDAYALAQNNAAVIKGLQDSMKDLPAAFKAIEDALKTVTKDTPLAFSQNEVLAQLKKDYADLQDAVKALEGSKEMLDITKEGNPAKDCKETLDDIIERTGAIDIEQDLADDAAYIQYNKDVVGLTAAHQAAIAQIDKLTDDNAYEGEGDALAQIKTKYKELLSKAVADAKDAAGIGTTIKGAADKLPAAQEAFEAAKAELEQIVEDATAEATGYNGVYATALEAVDALKTAFDEVDVKVPANFEEDYTPKRDAIAVAIDAMRADIDKHYAANDLTAKTYEKANADIEKLISDLQKYLTSIDKVMVEQNKLNVLYDALEDALTPPTTADEASYTFAEGKFQKNIDDINTGIEKLQAEINKITPENIDDPKTEIPELDTADLQAAIDLLDEGMAKLAGVVKTVDTFATGFKTSVENVDAYATANLTVIDGNINTWKKFTSDNQAYKDLKKEYDTFSKNYAAAQANETTPEECYTLFTNLNITYDHKTVSNGVIEAYCKFIAAGNLKVAQDKVDYMEDLYAEMTQPGGCLESEPDKFDFTEIDEKMTALTTEAGKVKDVKSANTCADNITKALKDIDKLKKDFDVYGDDHNAFTDLQKYVLDSNKADKFDKALAEATSTNNDTSVDPALSHYAKVIDDLQTSYNDLWTSIENDHKATKLLAKKESYKLQLQKLIDDATALKSDITNNHKALQAAIEAGESARVVVNGLLELLKDFKDNGVEGESQNFVKDKEDTAKKLNDVLHAIDDVNAQATADYGKGIAAEGNYDDSLQELLDQANKDYNDFADTYGDKVGKHNQDVYDNVWMPLYQKLDNVHNTNIKALENYTKIKHEAYKATLQEILDEALANSANSPLFQFAKQIRELKAEVDEWFLNAKDPKNENYGPINPTTNEDFLGFKERVNNLINEIIAEAEPLTSEVAAAAQAYYAEVLPDVEEAIRIANETMTNNGIVKGEDGKATLATLAGSGNAEGYLKQATDAYAKATAKPAEGQIAPDLGLAMDEIAQKLDDAKEAINLPEAAKLQWEANYTGATATLGDLQDTLDECPLASKETIAAAQKAINDAVAKATELNNDAVANKDLLKEETTTEKGLVDYTAELNAQVKAAEDAVKIAEEEQTNATDNDKLYQDYADSYGTLIEQLATLRSDVSGFAGQYASAVKTAEDKIADFKEAFERLKGDLANDKITAADKKLIDDLQKIAENSIATAYTSAKNAEITFINAQLEHVKTVYNDAKANASLDDQAEQDRLAALDKEVRALEDLINNGKKVDDKVVTLAGLAFTAKDNKDFKAFAQEIVDALDALEVKIDSTAADNARAALDTLAGEVSAAIEKGQSDLGKCEPSVQTKYAGRYEKLADEVADLKAQWQEGNSVLSQKYNFTTRLNEIKAEAEALAKDIAADDVVAKAEAAKIKANEDSYTALSAEHKGLVDALEALETRLEGFNKLSAYETTLENLATTLELSKEALENDYKKVNLTAESELQNGKTVKQKLDYIAFYETYAYYLKKFTDEVENCTSKITNAVAALADKNMRLTPKMRQDIKDAIAEIETEIQNLRNKHNEGLDVEATYPFTVAQIDEFIKDANDIIEHADNVVKENVTDLAFLAGDVDSDEAVNVNDAMTVIQWVGKRADFADLLEADQRKATAADIDGNEVLNIGDATAIVNIALGYEPSTVRFAMGSRTNAGTHHIFAELVSEENGVSRYAINLLNSEVFVAGQFDLNFPAGTMIKDITLGERAASHDLYTFDNNGSVRVIVASMENAAIQGSNGALIYVDVMNDGNLTVDEAIFADSQARTYGVGGNGTSSMDVIRENLRDLKETIYNAAGQTLNRVQRGINIIRKSDGTTTKEYRK